MRNDNLKKTGQVPNIWVELGFGTVCIDPLPHPLGYWVFNNQADRKG